MRVVLVGAEFEENLAIRSLWGALAAAGHEVVQVVFNAPEELPEAARAIADADAPLVGMSMVFTTRAREFADLATEARRLGHRGLLVAGGHFAAFHAEQLLADVPAFDAICTGEGEQVLCALAADPSAIGSIAGLVHRSAGLVVRNPPADKLTDLDALPVPPRKSPLDSYLGLGITNLLGSRGCLHGCAFCSIVAWHKMTGGPRLRMRAPDRVADEMADLYRRGARIFNFHDDNFFLPSREETFDRIRALSRALGRRGVGRIAFAIKARPDEVDEELFAELVEMGLFRVFLGVEAGTAESLKRLGRGQHLSDNERALEVVNRLGLHACFNLLMWNPSSTLEDVADNVAFLRRRPDNPMNFCRTEIYSGTPLERLLRRQGRLLGDYWGWDYEIEDRRAQAMFEVVFPAFRERNYGHEGIHHLAMQVDYEEQLLGHFFGGRAALRRRTKAFVVEVNRNTCRHLEAAAEWAARAPEDRSAWEAFSLELGDRVRADDARLRKTARALLDDIRRAAREPRPVRTVGWRRAATAAGVAVVLAACADDTHPTEMAPHPPLVAPGPPPPPPQADGGTPTQPTPPPDAGVATHMFEMVAIPPPAPQPGNPAAIRRQLLGEAAAVLAQHIPPRLGAQIELLTDQQGHVMRATVQRPSLYPESRQALEAALSALTFVGPEVGNRLFIVRLTAREIHPAPVQDLPPPTHPSEMAPHPPTHPHEMVPRRPTHPTEMAPVPPKKK